MSFLPKRPSKYKASDQAQPSDKNGSYSPESNQEATNAPLDSQKASDIAEISSAMIPALHRPPARPAAQAPSQSSPELALESPTFMSSQDAEVERQQPIPPPSEPMQYRAIGLVQGQYIPSEQQFNRGVLLTADGTLLDAVLLGRVMSLVRKHLNLEQEHLWVVYPRTREKHSSLHIQILGVWEPALNPEQTLSPPESDSTENRSISDGYFSVRGEVIYQAEDKGYVVVKVKQAPRKDSENGKSFKLRLEGVLPPKALGYFWSLDARRQENTLIIEQSHSIAMVPPQKSKGQRKPRPRSYQRRDLQDSTHSSGSGPFSAQPMRQKTVGKPIKRTQQADT